MQEKEKYNNQPDDFSELIRRKVEDHKMSVEADCWDAIELRLKPKRKPIVWWVASGAAVAAIILILQLFLPEKNGNLYFDSVKTKEITNLTLPFSPSTGNSKEVEKGKTINLKEVKKKKSTESVQLISQKASKTISKKDGSSGTTQPVENSLLIIDSVQLADIGNSLTIAEPDKETEQKADSVPSLLKKEIKKEDKPSKILIEKTKKQEKWLLAASFSSGGSSSIGGENPKSYDSPGSLPPALEDVSNTNFNKFISSEDFSNINHSMPVSFGVSLRKDLNERIGIETGLMYTYLSSKFNNGGQAQAKQELHYLGLPVNIVIYLWNNPNWNIYASGGAMIEKGLKMNYNQSIYQGNKPPSEFSSNKSINGVQWSINASIGIGYKIYQNWGLYFEPRYSYFFDNNQPFSIRTENSQTFGLSAGLRYEF